MTDRHSLGTRPSRLRSWLSPSEAPRPADLIFVLAGGLARKEYALQLLRENFAPGILFSVGRFEIRRFSKMSLPVPLDLLKLAQSVPPHLRHYFVLFRGQDVDVKHVPPRSFGTRTEIESLARWLAGHTEIRSVLVVSSDYHLRRVRMCSRAFLPRYVEVCFAAVPRSCEGPSEHTSALDELQELEKVLMYWILLKFRVKPLAS